MNTRIEYMYRDGENFKQFHEVVVAGEVSLDQLQPYYYEGDFFMPSEVGLADLQESPFRDCDHVWHELQETAFTEDLPTVDIDAMALLTRFKVAGSAKWNTKTVTARMMEIEHMTPWKVG